MLPSRRITTSGGDVFKDEYSLAFDGTDDSVDCGDAAAFSFGDGSDDSAFSISAWIYMTDATNFGILTKGTSEWSLHTGTTDKLYFLINDLLPIHYEGVGSSSTLSENQWIHVAATYNGVGGEDATAGMTLYVDGVSVATTAIELGDYTAMHNTNINVVIGYRTDYSNGKISNVALYNVELTASQVATIYNGREPYNHKEGVASGSLVGWWRMGDGVLDNKVTNGLIADQTNSTITTLLIDDFSSDPTDDWAAVENTEVWASAEPVGYAYRLEATTTNSNKGCNRGGFVTEGNTYHVKFKAKSDSSGIAFTSVGNNNELRAVLNPTLTASYQNYEFYTRTDSSELFRLYVGARSVGEYLWIDDIDIKQVNGNSGLMVNMTADDFVGDTP